MRFFLKALHLIIFFFFTYWRTIYRCTVNMNLYEEVEADVNRVKMDTTACLGVDRVALGGEENDLAASEDKWENSTGGL